MKKKILVLWLSAVLLLGLYGCGTQDSTGVADAQAATSSSEGALAAGDTEEAAGESAQSDTAEASDADSTDYTTGSPWINSNIAGNVESAGEVEYKDHFDLAVNGEWVKSHPINDGEPYMDFAGIFSVTLGQRILEIIEDDTDTEDHNAQLVNTLYTQFLDWDARDAAGTEPLMPYLQEIQKIQSKEDLAAFMGSTKYQFSNVFNLSMYADPSDSTRYILLLDTPSFFLNDTADYADLEQMSDSTRQTYEGEREKVETVLSRCGYTKEEADQIYEGAIRFEKLSAQWCYTGEEAYLIDVQETVNEQVYAPEELEKYGWYGTLKDAAAAVGVEEIPAVWLCDKIDYFDHLDELLGQENLTIIKDYLLAHTASEAMRLLDKECYYKGIDVLNAQNGATGYREESAYAVSTVIDVLPWPLSKIYCDKYVTAQDKQAVYDMIVEIVDGYKEMLQQEDFLAESTKEKAIEKLDKLRINCMYPDDWSKYDYGDLELGDGYFESMVKIEEYEIKKEFSAFYEPIDKDKWITAEPIVENAFYNPQNNSINILPGLVGDTFYNSEMSEEEAYGKLGAIIGHEISHAFDASGSTCDADGNYVDWWTVEDKAKYKEKTDKLVAYYDSISIWDGFSCSGEQVKTEACADMGGVSVLLHLAKKKPDFDYQTFFKAFAESWAENASPEYCYYIGSYDTHPLCYLRVNTTVAQFREFYDAFDVKEGDGMYIAPEDRVNIW